MKLLRLAFVFLAVQALGALVVNASTLALPPRAETQQLRWKKQVIQIAVSTSLTQDASNVKANSDVIGALARSLDAWSKASGIEFQLVTSDKQSVSPQGRIGDGVSLITIAPSAENLLIFARDPYAEAARTRTFFNRKGFITEGDIVLNPFQQFSSDGTYGTFDLETTFTHEIGHLLGLKHSPVIGSVMSDRVERNTTVKFSNENTSLLSESDLSAIRTLYAVETDECCGSVSGKLILQPGKPARQTIVWAEDVATGRLIAQTETLSDGTYRIGGVGNGEYSLYSQRKENGSDLIVELGRVTADKDDTSMAARKLSANRSAFSISHVGVNMQLGNSSIELGAGGEYQVVLGGKNLDPQSLTIEFNSPFLQTVSTSLRTEDFGDKVNAISFVLRVDDEAPAGNYSIYLRDPDGGRAVMIGAILVRKTLK